MTWKPLVIGELEAKIPIIQGGMGIGVSFSNLASAVANAGGVGIISGVIPGFREKDLLTNFREANIAGLRKAIRSARAASKGIIGVNIMVALTNYADMVVTAIEENADIIISGAGLPLDLPSYLKPGSKTKLAPIVSSEKAAQIIIKRWKQRYNYLPDAIVLESPLSGGHQGVKKADLYNPEYSIDSQLPKILAVVAEHKNEKNIPVVVAGGVYTGSDIKKYMDMGAGGVQMATRFIATLECDAAVEFKAKFLECARADEIVVLDSPVGLPLRVIRNSFIDEVFQSKHTPRGCPYKCLKTCDWNKVSFCIIKALINAVNGKVDEGILCSSVNGYRNSEIISVAELVKKLEAEYNAVVSGAPGAPGND